MTAGLADVTFIFVAFHRADSIAPLLPPLVNAGAQVVVVNVEADPAVQSVTTTSRAAHVPTAANVGFAAAVNAGVRHATREFVVFSNDDVTVEPGDVTRLVQPLRDGVADVAVPQVVNPDGSVDLTVAAVPTLGRFVLEWCLLPDHSLRWLRWMRVEKWRQPEVRETVDAASAVLVAAPRELLERHPIPEAYFLYWEESEWFLRLKREGCRTVYEPAAVVVHAGGRDDVRGAKEMLITRNAVRCIHRTQGRARALASVPAVIFWRLRLVVAAALVPGRRRTLRARLTGIRAIRAAALEALSPIAPDR